MQADLQRGVPHEVRLKALRALPLLPGHRLEVRLWAAAAAAWGVAPLLLLLRCRRHLLPIHAALNYPHCPLAHPPTINQQALLGEGHGLERLVLSLRSTHDGVRAAALETAAELTASERSLALAAESPAVLSALIDLWEGVADALTGD